MSWPLWQPDSLAALVGQVSAGRIVNQRQTTELLQLNADVAQQQVRAANAEARLLELKNRISWRKVPEVFAKTHYAKMSNEIPHAEPMPTIAIGIWLRLRELGNRRAGQSILLRRRAAVQAAVRTKQYVE